MNGDLPEDLREYIRTLNKEFAERLDNFWKVARSILDRQSRPNSNENGFPHVEMVERNAWRLIKKADKVSDFNLYELFLLSYGACSHDFDKGLYDKLPEGICHGVGSGDYLIEDHRALQLSDPEVVCIKKIIGVHSLPDGDFQNKLKEIDKTFPLSTCSVKLQKLAVVLKTADILHTDNSRIAAVGIDTSRMNPREKNKHLARQCISGWDVDGSRIIVQAVPETLEHLAALEGCIKYIKEKEWPAVRDKLADFDFPYDLEFKTDKSICGEPPALEEDSARPGDIYSTDKSVFNVPYREKGDGVVGRESALRQLREQLTQSRGTAIGQTASFHGMGGLGKTQLAVEYAHRFKKHYPNGVIWINADQEIDPQLIQIAKKGDWIAPVSEHKLILDIARRRLKIYSDCLVIFDNVDKTEDIKPYLPEPEAKPHIVLTSRKPQPGFEPIEIDILDEKESLELLMLESGRKLDSLSLEEKDAAKNIAIELGGLPLALEIAGAYLKYLKSLTFEKYLSILKKNPSAALPGEMLSSFTSHESDLYRTLKISESEFKGVPLLLDILDVLTWSGPSFMGTSLLSAMLDVDESELFRPLGFGAELRILRKKEDQDRYEIHRLLGKIRREEFVLEKNREWADIACNRIGSWFEVRRKNFADLVEYESEIDHLKKWFENSEKIKSHQQPRLLWLQAYPSYHLGNYQETLHLAKAALDVYEKSSEKSEDLYSNILNDIGFAYALLGDPIKGLEYCEHSLRIREKHHGPEHPDTANSLNNIGGTYGILREHQKALEFQERALKIREKRLGPEHPETATSLSNVGMTYGKLGDSNKALWFQERALKIREKRLGSEHPDTATSLDNLGRRYEKLGNHKKALEFHKRAFTIRNNKLGPEHPDTISSLKSTILSLTKIKKFPDANNFLKIFLKILPEENSEYLNCASLIDYIDRESKKSGFRPPSSIKTNNKKKTKRKKK